MLINFTALEVFEIAEQIERNGAKFYRDAALASASRESSELFLKLAEMEDKHRIIFADMLKNYKDAVDTNIFDPDNEMLYYMRGMALNSGWEGKAAPDMKFTGKETPEEILKIALKAEQTSINFYLGIKEFVKSDLDKEKIEQIIREEMGHLAQLQKNLELMQKGV